MDCKINVGHLGNNGNRTELEQDFVARNHPDSAFVQFKDPGDATSADGELELLNGDNRSRNCDLPSSRGHRPQDDY
ncbi:hypothetical protein FD755_016159 [Muntiacus reevesi]|uniref:RRM domain-containing protein n=1 Tax=Muntiacus reevesi TaxID=9886 RepID=A0A5N3XH11_MUNRE|nr:hypothetical protein FD755_016159 [Muntiacus reevesi]